MATKSLKLDSIAFRAVLAVVILVAVFASYQAMKWSFGNTIARGAENKELAEIAAFMAPGDPQSYFALASFNEKSFLPSDLQTALENYEKAVSASPFDFRLWLALGKARERAGNDKAAEQALRYARELAPNYAEVRWVLGNFLLRQGNSDEAFVEIRNAVEQNPTLAAPAVFTAWQIFDGDVSMIAGKIGDSAPIKASLAQFLARQKKFEDAMSFWNSVPDADKPEKYKVIGDDLVAQLIAVNNFRYALTVQNQMLPQNAERVAVGQLYNGDFEKEVKAANAGLFDWKIGEAAQPQISLDSGQKRNGTRSLIFVYNTENGKGLRSVRQTVAVEGNKTYRLEGFYKADLKTLAEIKWEVLDAMENKVIASSAAFSNSTEWQPLSIEFTTSANAQGVIIRVSEPTCKQAICPVSGKLWFDDLTIK
jgi:hypothetical protein